MSDRISEKNLAEIDRFYSEFLALHNGMTADESSAVNARLILVMANYVGDLEILRKMLDLAKGPSSGS